LALGACGASDDEPSGDKAEVTRLAESYYAALAERDWKAVCETRAPVEREGIAQGGGSCERTFEMAVKGRDGANRFFNEVEIGAVRVTGDDRARIDVVHPRQNEPMTGLLAVREDGQWFLEGMLGMPPRGFSG
jgi:hypothetical protein